VAVHLFARWARLFRREPLRHCIGAESVASRLWEERRPLGGAFMGGVTVFIGSARWWVAAYKYPVAQSSFSLPLSASVPA